MEIDYVLPPFSLFPPSPSLSMAVLAYIFISRVADFCHDSTLLKTSWFMMSHAGFHRIVFTRWQHCFGNSTPQRHRVIIKISACACPLQCCPLLKTGGCCSFRYCRYLQKSGNISLVWLSPTRPQDLLRLSFYSRLWTTWKRLWVYLEKREQNAEDNNIRPRIIYFINDKATPQCAFLYKRLFLFFLRTFWKL